ncbi:MAG: hypothetical protein ACTSWD_04750 [Candidatus Heimdallarchaeota archaeon]
MEEKYIDAQVFEDFKKNQDVMIETLNHNMTKLTDAVVEIKERLAELIGGFNVVKKIVWWILGIIAVIVGAGLLASINK